VLVNISLWTGFGKSQLQQAGHAHALQILDQIHPYPTRAGSFFMRDGCNLSLDHIDGRADHILQLLQGRVTSELTYRCVNLMSPHDQPLHSFCKSPLR
jgi:hypothetical protein